MITSSGGLIISDVPLGVKGVFNGAPTTPIFTTHIALRGTYLPGTVRCTSGNRLRFPSYVDSPQPDWLLIYCFADVRVNAYLLGTGPSTLTVIVKKTLYARRGSDDDYGLEQLESLRSAYERALSEGGRFEYADPLQGVLPPDGGLGPLRLGYTDVPMVTGPPGGIGGREFVLFVGPLYDLSVEAWEVLYTWDVERREDDTVVALHPYRRSFNREQQSYAEVELPALTQEVTAAHQARVVAYGGRIGGRSGLPMLVTDANQLRQFFSDPKVGAYAPSAPTPSQPPPACGLAVPDQADNPGLMRDCMTLLELKDTLRGAATLNWAATSTITTWEGVTLNASSTRVAELELDDEGLDGTIPPSLGELSALVTLDLSDNSLTGEIPAELGRLSNLETLRLSGNSFTGCIPLALRSVPTNDLSLLNLLYCRPPAPENLTTGTPAETSVPLSWHPVPNAGTYRAEYRLATSTEWLVDMDNATTTSHVVDDLTCGTGHSFRVSALGSGTVYASEWSEPSAPLSAATAACPRSP